MNRHKLSAIAICAVLLVTMSGCGPQHVNTNPTKYDKPAQILASVIDSTNSIESILKNHHVAKVAAIRSDSTLTNVARKKALTDETDSFENLNNIYKRALSTERDAANTIQSLAKSGASPQTAIDKVQIISNIVVNELLGSVSDPETRASLTQLNTLIQQLIASLKATASAPPIPMQIVFGLSSETTSAKKGGN